MGATSFMRTVSQGEMENFGPTYAEWQSETFFGKRLKPRRRADRRQAEPQRIRASFLNERIVLGEPARSMPIRLTGWQTTILLVVATVSFVALLAWAGFPIRPFVP